MRLGRTVAELEYELSAKELSEWMEFYNLEPWGWEADCYHAGMVAATIANVHRDPKRRSKPWQPIDFMPKDIQTRPRGKGLDPRRVRQDLMAAFGHRIKNARNH